MANLDYDFIGFTYNGKHSINDFNIYRTSDGSRYNNNIAPQMTDKAVDIPGGDGQYFFYTKHKAKQFSVNIAFDYLTEEKYREMRQWLSGKDIHDLIFDEYPYKVYSAKVTGTPQLKTVCFDEGGERIYKGEGTIQFTCYHPYAHTPDKTKNGEDGRLIDSYLEEDYPTKKQWEKASGLITKITTTENYGDLPSPFMVEIPKVQDNLDDFKDGDFTIVIDGDIYLIKNGTTWREFAEQHSDKFKISFQDTTEVFETIDNRRVYRTSLGFIDVNKPIDKNYFFSKIILIDGKKHIKPKDAPWGFSWEEYLNNGLYTDIKLKFKEENGFQFVVTEDEKYYLKCRESLGGYHKVTSTTPVYQYAQYILYGEKILAGNSFTVDDLTITLQQDCYNLLWDSKTGIVMGSTGLDLETTPHQPIPYTGRSYGTLSVGGANRCSNNIKDNGTIKYNFWYY